MNFIIISIIVFDYVSVIKAYEEFVGIYSEEGQHLIKRAKHSIDTFVTNNPSNKYILEAKELLDDYSDDEEDFDY